MHCTHVHQPGSPEERPLFLPEVGSRSRSGAGERGLAHAEEMGVRSTGLYSDHCQPAQGVSRISLPIYRLLLQESRWGRLPVALETIACDPVVGRVCGFGGINSHHPRTALSPDAGCRRRCRCSLVEPHAPLQKADANRLGRQPVSTEDREGELGTAGVVGAIRGQSDALRRSHD